MPTIRSHTSKLLAATGAVVALGLAFTAGPAAADGQIAPYKMPGATVKEGTTQLAYHVAIPCDVNHRIENDVVKENHCAWTITPASASATFGTPDVGGDIYTYQRTQTGWNTAGSSNEVVDFRVVDDRVVENTETMFVNLSLDTQVCYQDIHSARHGCDSVGTSWYQGSVTILDNDRAPAVAKRRRHI